MGPRIASRIRKHGDPVPIQYHWPLRLEKLLVAPPGSRTALPDPWGAAHENPKGWRQVFISTTASAPIWRARSAIDWLMSLVEPYQIFPTSIFSINS